MDTMEENRPNFAKEYWVDNAIGEAAFILERIDKKWPTTVAAQIQADK